MNKKSVVPEAGGDVSKKYDKENVPIELFGRDHWSTLAYIETRVVDGVFRISPDVHMRTCRKNWRLAHNRGMISDDYPTRLNNGQEIEKHDDWSCLQDLVYVGLLSTYGKPNLNKMVKITERGYKVVAAIRRHKAKGETFRNFVL